MPGLQISEICFEFAYNLMETHAMPNKKENVFPSLQ